MMNASPAASVHRAPPSISTALAVWPETARHQYLRSLYAALSAHGVALGVDGVPIDTAFLRSHAERIGALHFHWPEFIWGRRGEYRTLGRIKRLVQVCQFVRVARALRIPIVWTVHNLRRHEGSDVLDKIGVGVIARSASLIVCHTEAARVEAARMHRLDEKRLVVMRIGSTPPSGEDAPASRSATLHDLGLSPERRTLLCFGLVRPYKGFDLAIEAMRVIGADYQLIVAGSPLEAAVAESLRQRAGSADNVRLVFDYLTDQHVANLFAACDVVLMPYRRVTSSAVLLSGLSAGRGVIASDAPLFEETLAPEPDAGELFRTGDVDALAQAIRRYFVIPLERRHLAANRLSQLYAWPVVTQPLAERLHALMS